MVLDNARAYVQPGPLWDPPALSVNVPVGMEFPYTPVFSGVWNLGPLWKWWLELIGWNCRLWNSNVGGIVGVGIGMEFR